MNDSKDGQPLAAVAATSEFTRGDIEAGFRHADVLIEREFATKPGHQGYIEPQAIALSRMSHRPVKMVMTREQAFHATGPTLEASVKLKLGATKDGRITAAEAELSLQAGG